MTIITKNARGPLLLLTARGCVGNGACPVEVADRLVACPASVQHDVNARSFSSVPPERVERDSKQSPSDATFPYVKIYPNEPVAKDLCWNPRMGPKPERFDMFFPGAGRTRSLSVPRPLHAISHFSVGTRIWWSFCIGTTPKSATKTARCARTKSTRDGSP